MKFIFRYTAITMALIGLAQLSFGQKGTLSGTITDEEIGETIIGASVFWTSDRTVGTITDDNGKYQLKIPAGRQRVVFSYTGMKTDTLTVNIKEGEITKLDVTLRDATKELGVVVVSAGKFEQKIEDLTVSMEVLKPDLIENKNTTSIETALEQTPGLVILDSEPQIRGGSGFNFGVGSRVGVLVDDLPVLVGDVGKAEWGFIPVENLEQVEVIKGASSVLYGSSALSGVINVRTAYPKAKPQTKVNVFTGMYSTPERKAAKWWGNEVPLYSGINFFHSRKFERLDVVVGGNGLYDHNFIGPPPVKEGFQVDTITNSDVSERKGRINFNIRYRPKKAEGLSFGVNGNFMKAHSNFSLVWLDTDTGIYQAYPGTMTLSDQIMMYIDPYITFYSKKGYRHSLKTRIFHTDNQNGNNQSNKSTVYFGDYQFQRKFTSIEDLTLTAGLSGNYTMSEAELYSGSGTPDNTARNFAAYMQFDKKFLKLISTSLGVRYEYYQINDQEFVVKPVFRGGLNCKVGQESYIRASFGQGYRFPTIAEKFIVTNAGGLGVYPNPNLGPETSWNGELGFKQGLKIWRFVGYLDVAGFWQEYYDAMEYVFAQWTTEQTLANSYGFGFKFVNSGDIQVRGIDISLLGQGKFTKDFGMNLLAGYTFTKPVSLKPHEIFAVDSSGTEFNYVNSSVDTSNYILKYRFQHIAKIDLELVYRKFALGYSTRYYSYMQNLDRTFYQLDETFLKTGIVEWRGDEYNNNTDVLVVGDGKKGTVVMDARFSYTISDKSKIAFIVNNALNKEYSLRPLKIEAPRTTAIQYTLKI